jgi:hypothetical protein
VRAVHDRHYATPPDSYDAYRWRLQLLAEETVGKAVRGQARQEDAAWAAAADSLGG